MTTQCIHCTREIDVGDVPVGEKVVCPICGNTGRVTMPGSVRPQRPSSRWSTWEIVMVIGVFAIAAMLFQILSILQGKQVIPR